VFEHPDPSVDLCAIYIGLAFEQLERASGQFPWFYMLAPDNIASEAFMRDLVPFESVRMVGYPNGLWDTANNAPIVRRGALATNPLLNYRGRPEFVVDIACFGGSSGSPVFIADAGSYALRSGVVAMGERLALLGILYAGPVQQQTGEIVDRPIPVASTAVFDTMINLGYVIRAAELHKIDQVVRARVKAQS